MKRTFLFIVLSYIISFPPISSQSLLFNSVYGSNKAEAAFKTILTKDGNLLTIGWTENTANSLSDLYLLKTDQEGLKIWEKTYGLSDRESGIALIETSNNNILLAGSGRSFGSGASDCLLINIDKDGKEIWSKAYGTGLEDYLRDIVQLPTGDILLCGYSQTSNQGTNLLVIKITQSGEILWSNTFGGPADEEGWSIAFDGTGDYYVGGWSKSTSNLNSDFYLVKLSPSGSLLFEKKYGGSNVDSGLSLLFDNNKLYFAGSSLSFGNGKSDLLLYTLATNGDVISQSSYGSSGDEYCRSICKFEDGYYLTGYTTGYNSLGSDIIIANANSQGDILNHYLVREEKDQDAWGVIKIDNTSLLVTGRGVHPDRNDYDCKLVKIQVKTTSIQSDNILLPFLCTPNPASHSINLHGIPEPGELRLVDMFGRNVFMASYTPNESIDVTMLESGLYSIIIESKDKIYTSKIVIMK